MRNNNENIIGLSIMIVGLFLASALSPLVSINTKAEGIDSDGDGLTDNEELTNYYNIYDITYPKASEGLYPNEVTIENIPFNYGYEDSDEKDYRIRVRTYYGEALPPFPPTYFISIIVRNEFGDPIGNIEPNEIEVDTPLYEDCDFYWHGPPGDWTIQIWQSGGDGGPAQIMDVTIGGHLNPFNDDTDNDGLLDGESIGVDIGEIDTGSYPLNPDSDLDYISDYDEANDLYLFIDFTNEQLTQNELHNLEFKGVVKRGSYKISITASSPNPDGQDMIVKLLCSDTDPPENPEPYEWSVKAEDVEFENTYIFYPDDLTGSPEIDRYIHHLLITPDDGSIFIHEIKIESKLDILDDDTDDDLLLDGVEINGDINDIPTFPLNLDSDGDNLSDGLESGFYEPQGKDTKGWVWDSICIIPESEWVQYDHDIFSTTEPLNRDSDEDTLWDGDEDRNHDGFVDSMDADPNDIDTDGDTINDNLEGFEISSWKADVDNDGYCNANDIDSDYDWLSDNGEINEFDTNPVDYDKDNDGMPDGKEFKVLFRVNSCNYDENTWIECRIEDTLKYFEWSASNADKSGAEILDFQTSEEYDIYYNNNNDKLYVDSDLDVDIVEYAYSIDCSDTENIPNPSYNTKDLEVLICEDLDSDNVINVEDKDSDGDGWYDGWEDSNQNRLYEWQEEKEGEVGDECENGGYGTNPWNHDSDGDGLYDGWHDSNNNMDWDSGEERGDGGRFNIIGESTFHGHGTDPLDVDTDGDGLWDGYNVGTNGGELTIETDNLDGDTDDDGLPDGRRGSYGEDINKNGVVDLDESSPLIFDTDDDGLGDGLERGLTYSILLYLLPNDTDSEIFIEDEDPDTTTDPSDADSDDDGLIDGWLEGLIGEDKDCDGEVDSGETKSHEFDTDGDGLGDGVEQKLTTPEHPTREDDTDTIIFIPDADPTTFTGVFDADSDDDGLPDGWIDYNENNDLELIEYEDKNGNGKVDSEESNPNEGDSDGDGLKDGQECGIYSSILLDDTDTTSENYKTDFDEGITKTYPWDNDSDDDTLPDGWIDINENGIKNKFEFEDKNLDGKIEGDSNQNGIWDSDETWLETDPNSHDTDDDTYGDAEELTYEIDPLNSNDPTFDLTRGETLFSKNEITFYQVLIDHSEFFGFTKSDDYDFGFDWDRGIPGVFETTGEIGARAYVNIKVGIEIDIYAKVNFKYERTSWFNKNDVTDEGSFNYVSKMDFKYSELEFSFKVKPIIYAYLKGEVYGSANIECSIDDDYEYEILDVSICKGEAIGNYEGGYDFIDIDYTGDNKLTTTDFFEFFNPVGSLMQSAAMGIDFSDPLCGIIDFNEGGISIDLDVIAEAGCFFELLGVIKEDIKAKIDSITILDEVNSYSNLDEYKYREIDLAPYQNKAGKNLEIITDNFRYTILPVVRYYYNCGVDFKIGINIDIPDIDLLIYTWETPDIDIEWIYSKSKGSGDRNDKDSWVSWSPYEEILEIGLYGGPITQSTKILKKVSTDHSHEYDVSTSGQSLVEELDIAGSKEWDLGVPKLNLTYDIDFAPHLDINSKVHSHVDKDLTRPGEPYFYNISMGSDNVEQGSFWISSVYDIELILDLPEVPNPAKILDDIPLLGDIFDDMDDTIDLGSITLIDEEGDFEDLLNWKGKYYQNITLVPPNLVELKIIIDWYMCDGKQDRIISINEDVLTSPGNWETSPIMHFGIYCYLSFFEELIWMDLGFFNADLILKGEGKYTGDLSFTQDSDHWASETIDNIYFDKPGDYYSCDIYPRFIQKAGESESIETEIKDYEYVLEQLDLTTRFTGGLYGGSLLGTIPMTLNHDWDFFTTTQGFDPVSLSNISDKNTIDIPN